MVRFERILVKHDDNKLHFQGYWMRKGQCSRGLRSCRSLLGLDCTNHTEILIIETNEESILVNL